MQGLTKCRLVVLQSTPFCPFECSYCYLPDRDDRRCMSERVLSAVAEQILHPQWADPVPSVVWHAGEPLALRADWYDAAMSLIGSRTFPTVSPRWGLQTSGIGLDDAWLALLRRWNIGIGLSLDGPADLHDATRRTRGGKGTFGAAMRAVGRLREAEIPFHVITVLTRAHLGEADRLFDFYLEAGIRRVCFNVEEVEGAHRASSLAFAGVERAYRAFLERFLERWSACPDRIWVREFAEAIALLATDERDGFNEQTEPLAALSVAVDGGVSSFSPELLGLASDRHGSFVFGNLLEEPFAVIAERIRSSEIAREIASGVAACRASCSYFPLCGGGAPVNKLAEHGRLDATETLFCRLTRKVLFDVVLDALERGLRLTDQAVVASDGQEVHL